MSRHRGLVEVLVLGALVRVAVALTRAPAVYQDSLVYIRLSKDAPFSFSALRPNGYPFLMRIVSLGSDSLRRVTDAQHVAGLLLGVLVYVLLLRLGTRRWIAVAAVAVIVLDSYTVALEQDVLSETFFTVFVMASVFLVAATDRGPAALVASGLLLGMAVTIRAVGIFALPVWIVYVGLLQLGWRRCLMATTALLAPVLGYFAFHQVHGGTFGLTDGDGWFLYAKVAPIADCRHASVPEATRPLCDAPTGEVPDFYLFSRSSPAQILFFGPDGDVDLDDRITPENGRLLRSFAFGVIRAHPIAYSEMVAKDVLHYLGPDKQAPVELSLYGAPDSLIMRYQRLFHVPWWLIPAASLVAVAALVVGRRPPARRLEIALMAGIGWALLVGSAATAGFNPRYTIPLVPLFVVAAALAAQVLTARTTSGDTASGDTTSGDTASGVTASGDTGPNDTGRDDTGATGAGGIVSGG